MKRKSKMRSKINWSVIIATVLAIVLAVLLLYLCNRQQCLKIIDIISILGSVITLLGLYIAWLQIKDIKDDVEETKQKLIANFTIKGNSDAIRYINDIQRSLQQQCYPAAELRMKDLKGIFADLENNEDFMELLRRREIDINEDIIDIINTDIVSLTYTTTLAADKIIERLLKFESLLQSFESTQKIKIQ